MSFLNKMEKEILNQLEKDLSDKDFKDIKSVLDTHNEVDTAEFLSGLEIKNTVLIFRLLNKDVAADVFAYLEPELQQHIVNAMTDDELSAVIKELFADQVVDLVGELPAGVAQRVLKTVPAEKRAMVNRFLKYPENSAGSIMTGELVHLKKSMSVKEALAVVRSSDIDDEIIYTNYVTDARRHLEGVVHVKDLLMAQDDELVRDIMITDFVCTTTMTDQEEVGKLFSKYDLLNIPVIDEEGLLVGVVRVEDAVDVISDEATEDFELMAAMSPSEKPYLQTGVFTLAKNRIVWLLLLMVSATISGGILAKYEAAFAAYPLLVTFIPMLSDTGGNAGSQTSTLIIRGMALDEIKFSDFFKVFFKEFRVSIIAGATLAVVNFARIMIFNPGNILIAAIVSISLVFTVMLSKLIAVIMPMLAKLLGLDPAIMAAPLITTVVDALSLVVYFGVAKEFLVF